MGFVFQSFNLVPSLSARENVLVAAEISDDPMGVGEALRPVGLGHRSDHFPAQPSGGEQQRVTVVAIHPADAARLQAEGRLGVGYRVQVRITTSANPDALVVPPSALVRGPTGGWRVHAVRGGRARARAVRVGLMNDEQVEVTAGLRAGDLVIPVPDSDLADGARVRPVPSPTLLTAAQRGSSPLQ